MSRRQLQMIAVFGSLAVVACGVPLAIAQVALDEEFVREPTWKAPTDEEVLAQVTAWLDEAKPDAAVRQKIEQIWKGDSLTKPALVRLSDSFVLVDPRYQQLIDLCAKPHTEVKTPEFTWLT